MKNTFLVIISLFILTSCASAIKKQCEKTNWYDYGYQVAMSGKRLSGDSFIASCEKEEVPVNAGDLDLGFKAGMQNYCKPDIVFNTGKSGEFFNMDLCNPSDEKVLKRRHADGVQQFCESSNGYPVGTSGRKYNNICPKNLEPAFMKEYRRGRVVYLEQTILAKEHEIANLDSQASDIQQNINQKNYQIATLPKAQVIKRERKKDMFDNKETDSIIVTENDDTKKEREDLQWEIRRLNGQLETVRKNQSDARKEILELKKEKAGLSQ